MEVLTNGNNNFRRNRALHVLPRRIDRAHLYSRPKMSSCLKAKRQVERAVNPENVRMQCGEVDAIIELDEMSNPPRFRIVKIVKDKYDSSGYTK